MLDKIFNFFNAATIRKDANGNTYVGPEKQTSKPRVLNVIQRRI